MEIHIPITLAAEQAAWEEAQRRLRRKQSAVASKRTEAAAVRTMVSAIRSAKATTVRVTNYKQDGTPFVNVLTLHPVHDSNSEYRYSIGILSDGASAAERHFQRHRSRIVSGACWPARIRDRGSGHGMAELSAEELLSFYSKVCGMSYMFMRLRKELAGVRSPDPTTDHTASADLAARGMWVQTPEKLPPLPIPFGCFPAARWGPPRLRRASP